MEKKVNQSDWEIRFADILRMLQWDTHGVRRQHDTAIMMHEIMQNKAPKYVTKVFNPAYNLRDSSHELALQKPKAESFAKEDFISCC